MKETLLDRLTTNWMDFIAQHTNQLPNIDAVIRNNQSHIADWEEVCKFPVQLDVRKNGDGEKYVVTITDINGKSASLWTNETGMIRSIHGTII